MPQSYIKRLIKASECVSGTLFYHVHDNAAYYAQGVVDGMAQALDNLNIQYTYHSHSGTADNGLGCYTIPIRHTHENSCYTTVYGVYEKTSDWTGSVYDRCTRCGDTQGVGLEGVTHCYGTNLTCTIDTTIISGYSLGCGKTEETIESATIIY